jgi:DNA repair exonuclease SbcCD ATPase subunit
LACYAAHALINRSPSRLGWADVWRYHVQRDANSKDGFGVPDAPSNNHAEASVAAVPEEEHRMSAVWPAPKLLDHSTVAQQTPSSSVPASLRAGSPSTHVSKKRRKQGERTPVTVEYGTSASSSGTATIAATRRSPETSMLRQVFQSPPERRELGAELSEQLAQLQAQQKRTEDQAKEMRTLKRVNESLQAEVSEAQAGARRAKEVEAKLVGARAALAELLLRHHELEQRERERASERESAEIGTIGAQRIGHVVSEVWQEGSAVRTLAARVARVSADRKEAEKAKRAAAQSRKKAVAARQAASMVPPPPPATSPSKKVMAPPSLPQFGEHAAQDFAEQEDIWTLRLQELRDLEKRLAQDSDALERRKLLHIRELKRQRDERASQYRLRHTSAPAANPLP